MATTFVPAGNDAAIFGRKATRQSEAIPFMYHLQGRLVPPARVMEVLLGAGLTYQAANSYLASLIFKAMDREPGQGRHSGSPGGAD